MPQRPAPPVTSHITREYISKMFLYDVTGAACMYQLYREYRQPHGHASRCTQRGSYGQLSLGNSRWCDALITSVSQITPASTHLAQKPGRRDSTLPLLLRAALAWALFWRWYRGIKCCSGGGRGVISSEGEFEYFDPTGCLTDTFQLGHRAIRPSHGSQPSAHEDKGSIAVFVTWTILSVVF
jgi:hypothetical protein